MTGGRLKRVARYLEGEEAFCFTYGDGLANIDIRELVRFHRSHGRLATVTGVRPPARYGALMLDGTQVRGFEEKPATEGGMINGGYFVLSPKCIDLIADDKTSWEGEPLAALASAGELRAHLHEGFWQPMDTLREKNHLEALWDSGNPPWRIW